MLYNLFEGMAMTMAEGMNEGVGVDMEMKGPGLVVGSQVHLFLKTLRCCLAYVYFAIVVDPAYFVSTGLKF